MTGDRHPLMPWIAPAFVIAIAVALHFGVRPLFGDYVERVVIDSGIAVILAVSLNIVNGYTGQFSIGHAAFYALGGYAAAAVTYYGALVIWDSTTAWPNTYEYLPQASIQTCLFIAATLFGGLVAAGAGWLVGLPSLRLRGDYLAIVTLGFGEILRVLLQQTNDQIYARDQLSSETWREAFNKFVPPPVGGSDGFINIPDLTTLFWVVLLVGVTLIFAWRLKRSTFGRSMIAIRENEVAAEAMGVNVTRLKVQAFVLAAFFAGIAGSLYAHEPGTVLLPIEGGFVRSFDIVIMVVLGGLGSISGAMLAAILLTVANEWLRDPTHVWHIAGIVLVIRLIVWPHQRLRAAVWGVILIGLAELAYMLAEHWEVALGDYRMILYALVLILMMILRPGGLFGTSEITDLFQQRRRLLERGRRPEAVPTT